MLSSGVVEVPRETTARPTTTVVPRRAKFTQLTDSFYSSTVTPLIPFEDFTRALDAVFFAGYPANILSRFPELIVSKSLAVSSVRIVPHTNFSEMMVQVDQEYTGRGVNVSGISDDVQGVFGKRMVNPLKWRTNPPISSRAFNETVGGMSVDTFFRNLDINTLVIERILSSLGWSNELEFILLRYLLRDAAEKQSRFAECLKLIEESPRVEFATSILPEIQKRKNLDPTRYTLENVLLNAFNLFSMTSLDITQKRAVRVVDYLTPDMTTELYMLPVDEIFPSLIGNFNANKLKSSKTSGSHVRAFGEDSWLEQVYIGKDVDPETLENLKSILGYNPFEGRFDRIGTIDDTELAKQITKMLAGKPNRRQVIGVLLGWIRESLKEIVNRNLHVVLE